MSEDLKPYSKFRGFVVYWMTCFMLWFFVAPIIAPTDVDPPGADPVPLRLILVQVVVCYGLPIYFVRLDAWMERKSS